MVRCSPQLSLDSEDELKRSAASIGCDLAAVTSNDLTFAGDAQIGATELGSSKVKSLGYFLFSFSALLALGLIFRDGEPQPSVFANIDRIVVVHLRDPGFFAIGAKDIYNFGWFTDDNKWLIHLWPPGFMLLEGWILKLFGLQAPIVFILQFTSSLVAAAMMLFQRKLLIPLVEPSVASILPFVIFIFPVVREFMIEPIGVVFGETYSVSFFILGITLILLSLQTQQNSLLCL